MEWKERWNKELYELFRVIRADISKIKFNKSFWIVWTEQKHMDKLNNQIKILNSKINNNFNDSIKSFKL